MLNVSLIKLFDKHVDDTASGRTVDFDYEENVPSATNQTDAYFEALNNPNEFAASTPVGTKSVKVRINPNADRVYYAHELGHLASQQTDLGYFVNKAPSEP